jgi:hypothetical protein
MKKCECLEKCPFFNDKMKEKPALAQIYKRKYCLEGGKEECARYKVRKTLGPDHVPFDLYPNQADKADTLLAQ